MGSKVEVELTKEAHQQLKALPDFIQPIAQQALSALGYTAVAPNAQKRSVAGTLLQTLHAYGVTHYMVNLHYSVDADKRLATVNDITYIECAGPH